MTRIRGLLTVFLLEFPVKSRSVLCSAGAMGLLLFALGCGGGGGGNGGVNPLTPSTAPVQTDTEAKSSLSRSLTPELAESDFQTFARDQRTFAWKLFQVLPGTGENRFFSPLSVWTAMGMAYAGATGATAEEMASGLSITLPDSTFHQGMNRLDLLLASYGEGTRAGDTAATPFKLRVVNTLWAQHGFTLLAGFLDVLGVNYGAGVRLLDFSGDVEGARQSINSFLAAATENKITDLIPAGALSALTRLVLTNAVYFYANWDSQFNPEQTQTKPFYGLDQVTQSVQMMTQTAYFPFAETDEYQAIEIPYEGKTVSMVIILPASGTFSAFSGAFTATTYDGIIQALSSREVQLSLPKFTTRVSFQLKEAFEALGMAIPFDPGRADFSGITNEMALYIGEVIHQAFIKVDEYGTEAAAATAVIMVGTAMPDPSTPAAMVIDRPFLCGIRDRETGVLLFLGQMLKIETP
jgi:serpin B